MKTDYEHVVVGLGGLGSAAAYWLARRSGGAVLGLDRFELGHLNGASEDHSRIIRRSYHTPGYVTLADQAYRAWEELERVGGERLVVRTGGLDLWPPGAAIPIEGYAESMEAAGVPFETLGPDEITRRWPGWRLADDTIGLFQPDAGIVAASRCNDVHRRLAREHGATLVDRTPVTAIRQGAGELVVDTRDGSYACARLVLAADAWINGLLSEFGVRLPLAVTLEQVTYFEAPGGDQFAPERFPIWIWMDDPCFYGFPAFGEAGPKVAQDCGGRTVTAEDRRFDPDREALGRVQDFLRAHLPGALGPVITTRTCLYTLTPDRDLVIDALPGHPDVFVALGAAHGFKFASLIGRILADLAIDGKTAIDLGPYRIDRPLLGEEDPPTNWLV